ncbi:MAG: tRNA uridine-5-carboxymethylaminomethyl(34) synthesis GTPase MnmE [Oscillospiraceae bacterium]|nr:tRNA uridine-5-carboxymethylaminomethyl(34) synthesis GTPase MnmE [Oscillospiraceae bacterium]
MADIIAALATAPARSAIGILRLSGPDCARVAGQVFTPDRGGTLSDCPAHRLCLGQLRDRQGRLIDRCQAVFSPAPHSYTGEDTVELQCHGSPAALSAALEALFAAGARQALPGEFTQRAFLNGRMDLSQAEAVIDLIDAETADAAANAASQVDGVLRRRVEELSDALAGVLAHFHAELDYPDEDIEPFQLPGCLEALEQTREGLTRLSESYRRGQVLRSGVRTVLLGRPNAGKSSLLNALAGYERVIVTPTPGTTRDTVEESLTLGGVLLRLVDTAGIRQSADEIEAMGVRRSLDAARGADLALFVCDGSEPLSEDDLQAMAAAKTAKCAIALVNKQDLPQVPLVLDFETVLGVSALTGQGLDQLEAEIRRRFGAGSADGSILVSARQAGAAERAIVCLDRAIAALRGGVSPDAALQDVEEALAALGEITGQTVGDQVLSAIFSRFCVGK